MNNSSDEWFVIDDIEKFVESTRVLVFDSFADSSEKTVDELTIMLSELSSDEIEELDMVLTQSEAMGIAKTFLKKQINKTSKEERYLIHTKKYMEMIESFNSRLVSNLLSNLVNKGLVESAYDNESNDFIFWIKDDEQNKKEKPETD